MFFNFEKSLKKQNKKKIINIFCSLPFNIYILFLLGKLAIKINPNDLYFQDYKNLIVSWTVIVNKEKEDNFKSLEIFILQLINLYENNKENEILFDLITYLNVAYLIMFNNDIVIYLEDIYDLNNSFDSFYEVNLLKYYDDFSKN